MVAKKYKALQELGAQSHYAFTVYPYSAQERNNRPWFR
jgi:hypothetical protein